mmetsp:Transcript_21325/g.53751  ORF Transcript_21325/g.53751 Transcript_21325/m.53751 type:complete len:97 (+) Transcript_21325:719-1009(+)
MATEPPSAMPPRKIMSLLSPLLGAMAECERRDGSALRSDTAPAGLAALADHVTGPGAALSPSLATGGTKKGGSRGVGRWFLPGRDEVVTNGHLPRF